MKEYVSFGEGPGTLVVIPGLAVKNVCDSECVLRGTFRKFTGDYKVYVIDRPAEVCEGATNADLAEACYRRMTELGISRADMIGISHGGMLAQYIAVRHPQTVRKLVLGVTLARRNATSDAALGHWLELAEKGDWEALNRDTYGKLFTPAFLERYKDAFEKLIATVRPDNPERFVRLVKASLTGGPYEQLHTISCPTLVIGSAQDAVLGTQGAQELASMIGCGLYMFEDYGHGVFDETPEFYEKAYEFFKEK